MTPEERTAALGFLERLAEELSRGTVDLPCFPNVVVRISRALDDPNITADRAVTAVGLEPRLAARLLQTANSAAFNTAGKPVLDLRAAITRLGYQMVRGIAMSYALQQLQGDPSMRPIVKPLTELWNESVTVACMSQLVARRTKVNPESAFLTGLLHGIGRLYVLARVVGEVPEIASNAPWLELVQGWQASIGKAVLENWGFPEEMCEAVGDQRDYERRWKHQASLTDVLIASLVLADALATPEPRTLATEGINAFLSTGLAHDECFIILAEAERRVAGIREALR